MRLHALLGELADAGVVLPVAAPDRRRFRAPRGALTPDLRAQVAVARADIITRLLDADAGGLSARIAEWPEDWRHAFEERATIMEFEGHRPREVVEEEVEACVRAQPARAFSATREGR